MLKAISLLILVLIFSCADTKNPVNNDENKKDTTEKIDTTIYDTNSTTIGTFDEKKLVTSNRLVYKWLDTLKAGEVFQTDNITEDNYNPYSSDYDALVYYIKDLPDPITGDICNTDCHLFFVNLETGKLESIGALWYSMNPDDFIFLNPIYEVSENK